MKIILVMYHLSPVMQFYCMFFVSLLKDMDANNPKHKMHAKFSFQFLPSSINTFNIPCRDQATTTSNFVPSLSTSNNGHYVTNFLLYIHIQLTEPSPYIETATAH